MIDTYNRHAYKAAVWAEAARLLQDTFLCDDAERPEIPCKAAFRGPQVVPPECIEEIVALITEAARKEEKNMQRFTVQELTNANPLVEEEEGPPTRRNGGKGKGAAAKGSASQRQKRKAVR